MGFKAEPVPATVLRRCDQPFGKKRSTADTRRQAETFKGYRMRNLPEKAKGLGRQAAGGVMGERTSLTGRRRDSGGSERARRRGRNVPDIAVTPTLHRVQPFHITLSPTTTTTTANAFNDAFPLRRSLRTSRPETRIFFHEPRPDEGRCPWCWRRHWPAALASPQARPACHRALALRHSRCTRRCR
jgi:hypothetical protein